MSLDKISSFLNIAPYSSVSNHGSCQLKDFQRFLFFIMYDFGLRLRDNNKNSWSKSWEASEKNVLHLQNKLLPHRTYPTKNSQKAWKTSLIRHNLCSGASFSSPKRGNFLQIKTFLFSMLSLPTCFEFAFNQYQFSRSF